MIPAPSRCQHSRGICATCLAEHHPHDPRARFPGDVLAYVAHHDGQQLTIALARAAIDAHPAREDARRGGAASQGDRPSPGGRSPLPRHDLGGTP